MTTRSNQRHRFGSDPIRGDLVVQSVRRAGDLSAHTCHTCGATSDRFTFMFLYLFVSEIFRLLRTVTRCTDGAGGCRGAYETLLQNSDNNHNVITLTLIY